MTNAKIVYLLIAITVISFSVLSAQPNASAQESDIYVAPLDEVPLPAPVVQDAWRGKNGIVYLNSQDGYNILSLGSGISAKQGVLWTKDLFATRKVWSRYIFTADSIKVGKYITSPDVRVKNNLMIGKPDYRWIFHTQFWLNQPDAITIAPEDKSATDGWNWDNSVEIHRNGKVGIGIHGNEMPGNYRLYVKGGILTEEVKVALKGTNNWSDNVFASNYKLLSLDDLELFIQKNGHLPDVPTAQDVVKNGLNLAKMDAILLQKIEELTLYVIELEKANRALREEIMRMKGAGND